MAAEIPEISPVVAVYSLVPATLHYIAEHIDEFHEWLTRQDPFLGIFVSPEAILLHLQQAHNALAPHCDTPIV